MTLPQPYFERDGITIFHARCEDILPFVRANLVVADPPYGVSFDTDFTRFSGGVSASFGTHAPVAHDDEPFDPQPILDLGVDTVLFGANAYSDRLPCGSWLVWDKRSTNGAKNVMSDGEVAWLNRGHGVYIFNHTWDGFNRASERGTAFHPTQKPVALMRWIVEKYSKPNDLIFDPYMGSGPVAAACHQLGRRYIGVELVESYCATAVRRLQQSVMKLDVA